MIQYHISIPSIGALLTLIFDLDYCTNLIFIHTLESSKSLITYIRPIYLPIISEYYIEMKSELQQFIHYIFGGGRRRTPPHPGCDTPSSNYTHIRKSKYIGCVVFWYIWIFSQNWFDIALENASDICIIQLHNSNEIIFSIIWAMIGRLQLYRSTHDITSPYWIVYSKYWLINNSVQIFEFATNIQLQYTI